MDPDIEHLAQCLFVAVFLLDFLGGFYRRPLDRSWYAIRTSSSASP